MIRLTAMFLTGLVIGAAISIVRADDDGLVSAEAASVAQEAGVDPLLLQGASNTTGLAPRAYLIAVGELKPPAPPIPQGWPFGGPVAQRIFCIESIESHHGAAMYNPQSWQGEHAQGWLGWLPSTARRWGVAIGDRVSEWAGAARMLASGAGNQFFGVAAGRC